MRRPQCVDDMLNVSTYIMDLEMEIEKLKTLDEILKMRLKKHEAETTRLHNIILEEGRKWADHHTDHAKKKYWYNFIGKLSK